MTLPYTDTDDDLVHTYRRVHANGEQTHVAVLTAGESRYVGVAYDIDPADMVPVAAECVAYDPTLEGAIERARRWMEQHPKGVLGDDGDSNGGGRVLGAIVKSAKKMNEYGNRQMEQMHEQQQGGQH